MAAQGGSSLEEKKVIYSMVGVGKSYGSKHVLKDISLSYFYGAKIGVLGLNGAGKSSLLRIMAGEDQDFRGEVHLSEGYSVGFFSQEPQLNPEKNVKEVVSEAVQPILDLLEKFDRINSRFGEDLDSETMTSLLEEQAKVQDSLDRLEAWSLEDRLNFAMEALCCPPADKPVSLLSGGEKRRVALCRLLLQEPDILLLDEPTNHLDAHSVTWLEKHLRQYKGTVIAVTHDRYFLDNVAQWILELDRGQGFPFKGNYTGWLEQKDKRMALEEKADQQRKKLLEKELEWIRMSPKARQAKSKARIQSYEDLLNQDREASSQKELSLYIPPGPRLGDLVVEAVDLAKSFENRLLIKSANFVVPPGAIVGVVGPNGMGKTTLFKLLIGEETLDSGTLRIGPTVKMGYMEQSRTALTPDKTVYEVISGGHDVISLGKREINARAYVAQFNFQGPDQQKKVDILSGGERNRVQLALLLKSGANFLLLDEPSNDLDVNTLRALEDALLSFAGCAMVISHDRWFLDRIATHILAFEGNGQLYWFEGQYSLYEENLRQRGVERSSKVAYQGVKR